MNKLSERRKVAMETLQKQLVLGTKPNKGTTQKRKDHPKIPLTTKDIERINKEIQKIKTKI